MYHSARDTKKHLLEFRARKKEGKKEAEYRKRMEPKRKKNLLAHVVILVNYKSINANAIPLTATECEKSLLRKREIIVIK